MACGGELGGGGLTSPRQKIEELLVTTQLREPLQQEVRHDSRAPVSLTVKKELNYFLL